jgi:hypothetical protein
MAVYFPLVPVVQGQRCGMAWNLTLPMRSDVSIKFPQN